MLKKIQGVLGTFLASGRLLPVVLLFAGVAAGTLGPSGTSGNAVAGTITYTYDSAGRLRTASFPDGTVVTYALDAGGNRTNKNVADTTAPGVPTGLAGHAVSASQINLTWSSETDNGIAGLAGYRIYRGGVQIGTSATASYSDTTVVGSSGYAYTVAAYDNSNNVSAQSSPVTVYTPDITPPTVPTNLAAGAPSSTLVNVSWSASTDSPPVGAGGSGLAGYKVYRNGVQIGTTSATTYGDSGVVVGSTTYTYTVAAYDNAGNASAQSTQVSVTTPDTIPPSVPTGLSASAPSSTQVNLSWSTSTDTGGSGLAGYRIYRGGVQIATSATNTYSDTTVVGTTTYTYTIAAYDNAGNVSAQSASVNIGTPDTIPPSIPTGLSATAVATHQINLSWNASTDTGGSGLAGYRVYRGGVQIAATASTSYSDTSVADTQTYSYTVTAYDNAGNNSAQSSAASATTPDGTPPSIPTGVTASAINKSQVNLTWNASTDNVGGSGVAGYKILRGGVQVATSASASYSDSSLSGGATYTYTIEAYDNAGNTSAPSSSVSATTYTPLTSSTDAVLSGASGLYGLYNVGGCTFGVCNFALKQKYGALSTVATFTTVNGVCISTYVTVVSGYIAVPSDGCEVDASPAAYGH